MKQVNLRQRSLEWIEFRRTHIGASDAVVIMGESPWKSPKELYYEKILGIQQDDNPYMKRGRDLEPLALECFESETGLQMFPMVFVHDKLEWMAASLDGITLDRKSFVEIKCPGKMDHKKALSGQIPSKYLPQLQHQIAVTGIEKGFYYSFDGESGICIEVKKDEELIKKILAKESDFWYCIKKLKPPEN